MNIQKIRTMLVAALFSACAIGVAHAQTLSVNGSTCPNATVTFAAGTININTAGCTGGVAQVPAINAATPPSGSVGSTYGFQFTASGSTPLSWTVSSGALPAGLNINSSSGLISGTPTGAETANFQVTASNSAGSSSPLSSSIVILAPSGPPSITNTAPTAAAVNTAYSFQFTATGAIPITYSISAGAPPTGITITPTGLLAGVPSGAAGSYSFTVTATNSVSTASQVVNMTLTAPVAPTITSFTPPGGTTSQAYTYTFGANGTSPITWDIASGTQPTGLQLSAAGVLSGTPTAAGTFTFVVRATNSAGNATQSVPVVIAPASTGAFGTVDINGNPILPAPVSRAAKAVVPTHSGPNGGSSNGSINGWSVPLTATACGNATPAITTAWYHNIDIMDYGVQSTVDYLDFAPNQAVIYGFTAPTPTAAQEAVNGQVIRLNYTQGPIGTPAWSFISLSSTPCDFDVSKIPSGTACYATAQNENGFTFQVKTGAGVAGICKLTPGQRYYINMRFQDARPAPTGTPTADACATQLSTRPGSATCGLLLQVQSY